MLDRRFVHRAPAQPGVLHHVLGLGPGAQHAVGQRPQGTRMRLLKAQCPLVLGLRQAGYGRGHQGDFGPSARAMSHTTGLARLDL